MADRVAGKPARWVLAATLVPQEGFEPREGCRQRANRLMMRGMGSITPSSIEPAKSNHAERWQREVWWSRGESNPWELLYPTGLGVWRTRRDSNPMHP